MNKLRITKSALFVLVLVSGVAWGQAKAPAPVQAPPPSPARRPARERPRRSPEMASLVRSFAGRWTVSEKLEKSDFTQPGERTGNAMFRLGPGTSLMELYRAHGSAGELRWLVVIWWDAKAKTYRFFTCANDDGCNDRGTAKWEGPKFVNTWERTIKGKKVVFRDSFTDISPTAFTLVAEASVAGGPMKRLVTTKYSRQAGRNQ